MSHRDKQYFDFMLGDNRLLRASLTPRHDGSYSPHLSEIVDITHPADDIPLTPVPCEQGSGQYEAFMQLLGLVLWKISKTATRLESVIIRAGVDDDGEKTLLKITHHFAPGVMVSRGRVADVVSVRREPY
ncbi:hypothetical protein I5R58_00510 [Serratia marcescens]|uniref:hypothetical protein n=1 Tax=Serratia marcescens TaxID=615 RepID=UPI0011CBDF0D|nr:hypothetical protein [Serratia marcescens]MBH3274593.1 hypothetical protein [Serratia marcescens]MDM8339400.1 hypothetical protein [Serratia marcescens]TXE41880.1 hypothetical protein FOT61_14000 [Serratia marcescens]